MHRPPNQKAGHRLPELLRVYLSTATACAVADIFGSLCCLVREISVSLDSFHSLLFSRKKDKENFKLRVEPMLQESKQARRPAREERCPSQKDSCRVLAFLLSQLIPQSVVINQSFPRTATSPLILFISHFPFSILHSQ